MKKISTSLCIAVASLALISCSHKKKENHGQKSPPPPVHADMKYKANLISKSGSKVKGTVEFNQVGNSVTLKISATGLKSNSAHGFHIHEFGDCSSEDATTAGDHFAGRSPTHGAPHSDAHHSGDLGNLQADAQGKVEKEETFSFLKLHGPESILGRAVVIHEKADDLKSQPSGDAGKRIACGVIGISK